MFLISKLRMRGFVRTITSHSVFDVGRLDDGFQAKITHNGDDLRLISRKSFPLKTDQLHSTVNSEQSIDQTNQPTSKQDNETLIHHQEKPKNKVFHCRRGRLWNPDCPRQTEIPTNKETRRNSATATRRRHRPPNE
jgi:hypothetical protein